MTSGHLAIASLIALEALVVAWAATPNVDPVYRAVYVDRTSDCYPLAVSGAYRLGERLSFATDGDADKRLAVTRCGFREPDRVGSWSDGKESRLRFRLDRGAADLALELELAPFISDAVTVQRVLVDANDTRVADLVLTEPRLETISVPISRDLLSPAEMVLDITLTYPDAISPLELGLSKDRYAYAIHLVALRLGDAIDEKQSAVPREGRNRAR